MFDLTCTTVNAIRNAKAFKDACEKAERAAIQGTVTDMLGEEWTKKQFEAVNWKDVLAANYLKGAIYIPSVDALRDYGWVKYRVEEFELPETVKRKIGAGAFLATFEDGTTRAGSFNDWGRVTVGDIYEGKRITQIRECWPDFKGRRYVYRFV